MSAPFTASNFAVAETRPQSDSDKVHAIFFVTAAADPGMVPRLVEPIAKMGFVPSRVHISTEDGSGDMITADLRVSGISHQDANAMDKALRHIWGVQQVIAITE